MISVIGFILLAISVAIGIHLDDIKRSWLLVLLGVYILGMVLLVTGILN